MKKPVKIVLFLLVGLVLATAGLAAFVRFYLTDERIKAMLIPPAEQALARTVTIGNISVSLLSGITIRDFSIKEKEGSEDFLKAKSFVLRYELMPLLKKEVVVSEISLQEPTIRIHRDKEGRFNFESLALLADRATEKPGAGEQASKAAALPLALTVKEISVHKATVSVSDAKKELPAVSTTADIMLQVNVQDLKTVDYQGVVQFITEAAYRDIKPKIKGTCNFDRQKITLAADVNLDQESLHLDSRISEYATAPTVTLDLSSKSLNLDHLLAVMAGLPKAAQELDKTKKSTSKPAPIADSIPKNLTVAGKVQVDKALYNQLTVTNFLLTYGLKNGIFTINRLDAGTAGGAIGADTVEVDLNRPAPAYKGHLQVSGLDLNQLRKGIQPDGAEIAGGALGTSLDFSGAGTEWAQIKKNLAVAGTYQLVQGWIKNNEVSRTLAALVGLQELNDITFNDATGNIRVKDGQALLSSQMTGTDLGIKTEGTIGLDGALNLPLTITLSQPLSEKLRQRVSIAKYLSDEQGQSTLRLHLGGTVNKPRPALDESAVKEQAEKVIKKKLFEELNRALSKPDTAAPENQDQQPAPPAKDLLKGIFGL